MLLSSCFLITFRVLCFAALIICLLYHIFDVYERFLENEFCGFRLYTIKTTGGLVSDNIIASSDGDKSQKIQPSETEKTNNTEKTEPYVVTEIPDTEKSVDFTEAITENDIIVTEENPIDDEPVITEEQAEEKPSLEEYLGNLICTGCGKRCSLLAPRCRKGEMQAQSAMEDYEEMYSSGF